MRHHHRMIGTGFGLLGMVAASGVALKEVDECEKVIELPKEPHLVPQRSGKSKCSVCGRRFSTEEAFQHHVKAKH